jgi:hypothetical protein
MSIRRLFLVVLLALALVPTIAVAQQAQAPQTQVQQQTPKKTLEQIKEDTPQDALIGFIGYNAGGSLLSAIQEAGTSGSKPRAMGASLLFWGPGVLAGELDFGYNPDFYENFTDVVPSGATSNLETITLNFVLGPTFFIGESMRVRPYVLVGGGLMRSKISEFVEHLSFGDTDNRGVIDFAGGLYFYPIKRIGIRGDVRMFRGVGANGSDKGYGLSDWTFYRITIGVALAF